MEYIDNNTNHNESVKDSVGNEPVNKDSINQEYIIPGIDLGTTNSCISIWRNGNCEVIPDEYGNKTIPSYVSYTKYNKYVGNDAKKQKEININNVFYGVKRLIGRRYNDKNVSDLKDLLSYNIKENDRGCVSLITEDSVERTPEEISANILMKLKDMANKYLKREIKDVVITVPAHFNDSQRQATYDAATIAGLNCVRMINEPTAAALAYGMMERSSNKKEMTVLVYDFGGGTLDISIIEILDGYFDVKGSSGISYFGGVDFDNRIMTFCLAKFSRQYYKSSLDMNKISRVSLQKLRTQAESAKKILSDNTTAYVAIEDFYDGKNMFVKISRKDFENICIDLFLLCIQSIDDILNICNMKEENIDEVILVGGMTRIPYIKELLGNKFRGVNINCSINPDEAVSVGASIQGYILSNKDDAFSDSVTLQDITPLTLGVEVIGGIMDTIIKRGTALPCEKTKLYSTDTDYVDSVLIKIFEGERTLTMHNTKIAEFELDKIPITKRGVPEIEIKFEININGIVTVTAYEKEVNESKSIVVNVNKNGLKPDQLQRLVEEAREQETMDELNRIKKINHYEINDLCSNIIDNINNKDFNVRDVSKITDEINDILRWLKEKSYQDRELSELESVVDNIKRKYGVLITQGKDSDSKVKPVSDHINATTLYCKDDDEEEDEMRQAFEKVKKTELGITEGMSDIEMNEIKELRNSLIELCNTVNMSLSKVNFNTSDKQRILYYIDDTMLWYYSCENPKKNDFIDKINSINSLCDEIYAIYEKDIETITNKEESETDSERLEKMCLALLTMMNNNQLNYGRSQLGLLSNKINKILKYIYSNDKDNDYQSKCKDYYTNLNNLCNKIHEENTNVVKQDNNEKRGMSIMELIKQKQSEEVEELIESDNTDCTEKNDI